MDSFSTELLNSLSFLLPGFLTAWIFYGFTSYPKPSEFERVVQALIFTILVQVLLALTESLVLWAGGVISLGAWTYQSNLIWSVVLAILLGFLFSGAANNDFFHSMIRKFGLSKETSYASEWFGVFAKNVTYIILHLKDGRRIYGWPMEWPSEPEKGHFSLAQAAWIGVENEEIPLLDVELLLISAKDVQWVEFMKSNQDNEEDIESTTTAT